MDDLRLDLPGELGVEHLVGVVAELRRRRRCGAGSRRGPASGRRRTAPGRSAARRRASPPRSPRRPPRAPRACTGRRRSRGRRGRRTRALSRASCSARALAALADQIGVRIIGRPRLAALAARDREPLLRQVRAREVVGEVGGREDQRAVVQRSTEMCRAASPSSSLAWPLGFEQTQRDRLLCDLLVVEGRADPPSASAAACAGMSSGRLHS